MTIPDPSPMPPNPLPDPGRPSPVPDPGDPSREARGCDRDRPGARRHLVEIVGAIPRGGGNKHGYEHGDATLRLSRRLAAGAV